MEKNNLQVLKLEAEVEGNLATKCICKRYFILDRSCIDYVMVGESVKFILTSCNNMFTYVCFQLLRENLLF